jgi:DNA-binding NarL/FixJ family response regulator
MIPMNPIRVLIADDHTLVRAGMRALLAQVPEVEVIAEASDGREALQLIATHRPDVVLMDITMPGLNGLEATVRVAREFPQVRVIILSMHAVEEYVLQALHAGASGYLLKHAAPVELALALKAVVRGETYLSPPISKVVIAQYLQRTRGERDRSRAASAPYEQLTSRQREILQLIAEGHTTKDIAQRLNLSVSTVETHRTELMQRLDIHDVAGLVRYAIRTGLVSPDT